MSELGDWKTEMKKLNPGTYAYIQSEGTWFISNAGLLVDEEEAIVIDSLASGEMVRSFIQEIEKITDNPVKLLINTHFHGDHIYTNHFFQDATTICDTTTRNETVKSSPEEIELYSEIWSEIDFSESKITPQDISFDKEMRIYLENKEIHLDSVGPAHSPSDTFIYLPEEEIVFCGDLVFYLSTPFALMGNISNYIDAVENLIGLDAGIYIPGHGPPCNKEDLEEVLDYLSLVKEEAKKRFEEGMDYFEAAKDINLRRFADWANSERIVGNVARAYSEFRGEPANKKLDYQKIFLRMLEY